MNVFSDWHRFNYILTGIPAEWTIIGPSPVEKTMLWEDATKQVWWEFHDGVRDDFGLESDERLRLVLTKINKAKKVFYVKPNVSETRSKKFFDLCEKESVTMLTCLPWSYYAAYPIIVKNRFELRKKRSRGDTDLFAGNPNHPGRIEWCDSVSEKYKFINNVVPQVYIQEMLLCNRTLHPLGLSLRGSSYESIALGVQLVIQENSYLKHEIKNLTLCDQAEPIIDFFENNMLANTIVDSVRKQLW